MIQVEYMKVIGLKIKDMEMDLRDIRMETFIRENFRIINPMEREFIIGAIMKSMMENGKMGASMV